MFFWSSNSKNIISEALNGFLGEIETDLLEAKNQRRSNKRRPSEMLKAWKH